MECFFVYFPQISLHGLRLNRYTVTLNDTSTTFIQVGYDGHSLVVLANEEETSVAKNLIRSFPSNTNF